jgi:uncharacterized protein (TIGR03083 family)
MTTSTTQSPRLTPDRYIELIAADGERLADVAEGHLDDPVPPCPGWDVAEVVRHTGSVYHHKVACIRLGRRPEEGEWQQSPPEGADLLDWYRGALAGILEELRERKPDSPAYSWYPPEQDVAFWQRRMAQESVVHRVDAESASGQVTHADDELAVDGIDEVLDVFLRYGYSDNDVESDPDLDITRHAGRSFLVRTGPYAWHVAVASGEPEQILLQRESGPAQVTISGEPSELLLWMWGRRPDAAVTFAGDPAAAAALRDLLSIATQ